jgi:hypothetical protein
MQRGQDASNVSGKKVVMADMTEAGVLAKLNRIAKTE